jgi:integrase
MKKQNSKKAARRIGQVVQKSDNKDKWLIRIYLGKDDGGKRKFHSEAFSGTKSEAERKLRVKLVEIESGNHVNESSETLNEFLDRWLLLRKPAISIRTYDDYSEMLERYVRPAMGYRLISSLTSTDIQTLYTNMIGRRLSNRTVRYTHTILNAALKRALGMGVIKTNPAQSPDIELPKKESKEMRALSPEEVRKFLEVLKGDRYEAFFILALDSGMRPEEILGLKWEDMDLTRGAVIIRRTLCRKRKKPQDMRRALYLGIPKTSKSRRTILISQKTTAALISHRPPDSGPDDFVFTARGGGPVIAESLIRTHFKPALKRAGLPNIRLYDLRHTMATALLVAGVNPKIVSERLGHSSIVLTLDTYSHVIPGLQEMAIQKLEEVLFT